MAHSGFRSVVLFCVTAGAVGCSKSTSPTPTRVLPAKTTTDASHPTQPQAVTTEQGAAAPKAPTAPASPPLVV
ncbi:hypothetical protein ACYOEI_35215, partial [Singulisphaera rosea]